MGVACRGCGKSDLPVVLSLGSTPLANALRSASELDVPDPRYPLDVALCPACALVQLVETVDPAVLFADYAYLSSFSDTMLRHAQAYAERVLQSRALGANALVVEIGSNDGYLLRHFRQAGVAVLGIDPARAAAAAAERVGVPTRTAFFGRDLADQLVGEGIRADVIVANNVMAHVPEINDVVTGVVRLLKDDGVFVIETPYVRDLLDRLEFDTIYHEHVFYYSLTALRALLARHGLRVIDVERVSIHGGSIRVTAAARGRPNDAVFAMMEEEAAWRPHDPETYAAFAARVDALRFELSGLLRERKASGRRLAAYGAAAKGTTLLSVIGVGEDVLDFAVDRNPRKQGRYMPGTKVRIYPPEHLLEAMPDDVLLLTWNFRDEIMTQQAEYRRRGGQFIVPIPSPSIM
jgi:SAM-dependent methyltransferase